MTETAEPTQAGIRRAARLLRSGRLVAFPTETVYGLGGLATCPSAVRSIYAAKGRPAYNPLIIHVPDLAAAMVLGRFDQRSQRLARHYWPGPMTLVVPLEPDAELETAAIAGLDSVAIRVPSHPVAQSLLREVGAPVAAPSANPSGRLSPTAARHVAEDLGDAVALVLDGGNCPVGLESTIIGLLGDQPRLLRPGGLDRAAIEGLIGPLSVGEESGAPRAPGQLASHYAPRLPVRLDATEVGADEALLAFGAKVPPGAFVTANLSPAGDLTEAAANLFAMLRALDSSGATGIAVVPIPRSGLGEAIADRLRRAAAPR